jgi:hypothetical protein
MNVGPEAESRQARQEKPRERTSLLRSHDSVN